MQNNTNQFLERIDEQMDEEVWERIGSEQSDGQEIDNTIDKTLVKEVQLEIYDDIHKHIAYDTLSFVQRLHRDWSKKESIELALRAIVAIGLFSLLKEEVEFIQDMMLGIGKGDLIYESGVLNLFITVVFVEIATITTFSVKYLFSERGTTPLEIIQNVINNLSDSNNKYLQNKNDNQK